MNSGHGLPPAGGDQHRGEQLTILQSVFLFVATVLILLRLYVRTRVVPSLGLDDVFILLALVRDSMQAARLPETKIYR